MIIDYILDRKDDYEHGIKIYNAKDFYDYVRSEEDVFDFNPTISRAMDYGTDNEVKVAIDNYILENGYNPNICHFVDSVQWLTDDKQPFKETLHNILADTEDERADEVNNAIKSQVLQDLNIDELTDDYITLMDL